MSFSTVCLIAALRALVVAAGTAALARGLLGTSSRAALRERATVGLLGALLLTPDLAVGYAWSRHALRLGTLGVELLYAVLLAARLLPIAAALLALLPPPPVSASAVHVWKLSRRGAGGSIWKRLRHAGSRLIAAAQLRRLGPWRNFLLTSGLLFVLAFQEFDLAARLGAAAWTVRLFDVHARGLSVEDALRSAVQPAAWQAAAVLAVLLLVGIRSEPHAETAPDPLLEDGDSNRGPARGAALGLAVLVLLSTGMVVWELAGGLGRGGSAVARDAFRLRETLRDVVRTGGVALIASAASVGLADAVLRIGQIKTVPVGIYRAVAALVAFPGLAGDLVVGLTCQAVCRAPWLLPFYDTPVPWLTGLVVWLLPRALLVRWLTGSAGPAVHLRRLSAAAGGAARPALLRRLRWEQSVRPWTAAVLLLGWLAYLNLTIPSILSPVAVTSPVVRLYNQMHYGRSDVLSAWLGIVVTVPWLAAAAGWGMVRVWRRRGR